MRRRVDDSWTGKLGRMYLDPFEDQRNLEKRRARSITFQVTEGCNLCCSYCYQGAKSNKRMTLETGKRIMDMILSGDERISAYMPTNEIAGVAFDFIGGEPFLEIDLIDGIMDYFVERAFEMDHPLANKYMISMSSNGTLYFTEPVQKFIEKWKNHLSLSISVDGNKKLHDACRVFADGTGSYDMAIKAAMYHREHYGFIGSKMTIAPGNVEYTYEAVDEMLKNGYREIFLNCVFEEGWTIAHAKILYQQLKKLADRLLAMDEEAYLSIFDDWIGRKISEEDNQNWCGGTGAMLAFDPDGNAYPCLRYMPSSMNGQREPYTIGNLNDGIGITEADAAKVKALNEITRRSQSTDECWNCPIASGCAWCSGYNYQKFGTPNKRATFICVMHRARVLANCYYWNMLYIKNGSPERFPLDIPEEWGREIAGNDYDMLKELAEVKANGSN